MILIYLLGLKYEENTIVIRLLLINVCRRCKSTKFLSLLLISIIYTSFIIWNRILYDASIILSKSRDPWVVIQSQKNKIKKKNKAIKTKSNHFILMMLKFMTLNQISYTVPLLRASEWWAIAKGAASKSKQTADSWVKFIFFILYFLTQK